MDFFDTFRKNTTSDEPMINNEEAIERELSALVEESSYSFTNDR